MTRFHKFLAVMLLALWMPVTSHCYLEESRIWEIALESCCAGDSHAAAPATGDPCDTGCKLIEKSGYKFTNDQKYIPVIAIALIPFLEPALPAEIFRPEIKAIAWPSEILQLVSFVSRTALPVRAPSFVS